MQITTKTKELVENEVVIGYTCDVCKKEYKFDMKILQDDLELQEFVHINFTCGYGSVFGDGNKVPAIFTRAAK